MYHNKTNSHNTCAYCNTVQCSDNACIQAHILNTHIEGTNETVAQIEYPNIHTLFTRIYVSMIRYDDDEKFDKNFNDTLYGYMNDIDTYKKKYADTITMADLYIFASKHIYICRKLPIGTTINIDTKQYSLSDILTSLENWLLEFTPVDKQINKLMRTALRHLSSTK